MSEVVCPHCGHGNQPGANFCSSCGQPIERAADEPHTITFSLDPEDGLQISTDPTSVPPGGRLIVTRGPNPGAEFDLEHVITTVGRHPDSDLFLNDVTVSRRHVEIERGTDGSVVRDVGSLNGTYLNQELIEGDTPIANGDELQVGKFKLVFVAGEGSTS